MHYELIRTKRKTIAIYVIEGSIIVRAPVRTPVREIDAFVESKLLWIDKHIELWRKREEKRSAYKLDYGTAVLFLGNEYHINSGSGDDIFCFPMGLRTEQLRNRLIAFYKAQAQNIIVERVHYFSSLMGVRPSNIKIGSAKKSWASCSTSGRLIFAWRLITASTDAIDYVIVHELAHIKHMDHSYRFWNSVSEVIPDWKPRRKELHLLQKRLSDEGWD